MGDNEEDAAQGANANDNIRPVAGIKPPSPLVMDSKLTDNWKLFKQRWEIYSVIANLQQMTEKYRVNLLLHTLGESALKVYNGFQFPDGNDARTEQQIKDAFDSFAVGQINETYERYVFNSRIQREEEPFETFLAAIRSLVKSCNYCDACVNSILRDRIVLGIKDAQTQTSLLKEPNLTLANCITICKAAENATYQGRALRTETINKVTAQKTRKPEKQQDRKKTKVRQCKFCGNEHIMKKSECPAWGKQCSNCGKNNHFAKVCAALGKSAQPGAKVKKNVHSVEAEEHSSSDEEWVNSVTFEQVNAVQEKDVWCRMIVAGQDVNLQIDSGYHQPTAENVC